MKSLRFLSTLGVLAICTVFASAQDSGLGRGQRDKDSGSKSRNDSSAPANQGSSSSSRDQGRSKDRSSEPARSSPPQDSSRSKDRSSESRQPSSPPPQDPGRSRDRGSQPRQSPPPQNGGSGTPPGDLLPQRGSGSGSQGSTTGPSRDRGSQPRQSPPPQNGGSGTPPGDLLPQRGSGSGSQGSTTGPSRDRGSQPRQSPPTNDGGLGRGGSSSGSGSQGGSTTGPSRDRGSQPRQSPPTNDGGLGRGGSSSGSQGGTSRDRGSQPRQDAGLGRGQGSGSSGTVRDNNRDTLGQRVNPNIGPGQGLGRGSNQPSRSGSVNYRGTNNIDGRVNPKVAIIAPPTYGVIKSTSMESRARREDGPRHSNSLWVDGWRNGYSHYNNNWNDNHFWYPNYCFTPWGNVNIVISPWYSYTFLPGYLNCEHIYVTNYRGYWGWNTGFTYTSVNDNYGYNRSSQNRELDYTIEDLQDGFENRDFRALDRLVPDRGQIAIYRDGRYDYSIDTRDFSDLLNDLSSNANTNRYRILETRINRNSARISGLHEYTDQWGNRQRVYHSIYLENEHGDYVIREFGTSNSRVW